MNTLSWQSGISADEADGGEADLTDPTCQDQLIYGDPLQDLPMPAVK